MCPWFVFKSTVHFAPSKFGYNDNDQKKLSLLTKVNLRYFFLATCFIISNGGITKILFCMTYYTGCSIARIMGNLII